MSDGTAVGTLLGTADGDTVGTALGWSEGADVGVDEGTGVGDTVGISVGEPPRILKLGRSGVLRFLICAFFLFSFKRPRHPNDL